MIKKDRELLHRMTTINQGLGGVVLGMTARQDGGELNPDDLRTVGGGLYQLGKDMLDRADELTPRVIEQPTTPATSEYLYRAYRAVEDGLLTSTERLALADVLERAADQIRRSVT